MQRGNEVIPATITQFSRPGVTWVSDPVIVRRGLDRSTRIISIRSPEPHPNLIGVQLSELSNEGDLSLEPDNVGVIAVAEWGFDRGKCRATFDVVNGTAANFLCSNLNISVFLGIDNVEGVAVLPSIVPPATTIISGTVAWGGIQGHPRPQRTIRTGTLVEDNIGPTATFDFPVPAFARSLDILRIPFAQPYRVEILPLTFAGLGTPLSQHDVAGGADLPRILALPKRANTIRISMPFGPGQIDDMQLVFGLDM